MLLDDIKTTITSALKARDSRKVDTLRFLVAAIRNAAIAKYGAQGESGLTDNDILDVIKKQTKTHRESVDVFTKAGRSDLATKESEELAILESYLPKQLTDGEIQALLTPIVSTGQTDFGKLMGLAMASVKGQADGGRVAVILKRLLDAP